MAETVAVRVSFPSGDLSLEGALHVAGATPAPAVVVCHPHPQYGGDMDNNVVLAACRALASAGITALRFNFRGVAASDGAFDQGQGEQDDVRAALAHLASLSEVDGAALGLAGYSFGAMVSAAVASGELRALALVSPPLGSGGASAGWGCTTLVVGGDADQIAPADRLTLMGEAPGVDVRIFPGVDHSWWGHEEELGDALAEFFQRRLR